MFQNLKQNFFLILVFYFLFSCGTKKGEPGYSLTDSTKNSVEQLSSLIAQHPKDAALFSHRAALFMKSGNSSSAMNDMLAAVAIDSTEPEYFLQLGDIYFSRLFIAQAISSFEKCITLDNKNIAAELKLAELFLYLKKYSDCIKHSDNALRIDKTNAKAYFIKGFMFKETGDTTRAVSSFQTAVEQNPEYFDAFIQLGNLFSLKKSALALEYYNKALNLRKNSEEALYGVAMFFQENDNVDSAEAIYHKILETSPDYKEALFNIGYINLIYNDNFNKALDYFAAVNRLDTSDIRATYNRGLCFEKLKQKDLAERDYRKALQHNPEYELAKEGLKRLGKKL
jgi:tetratricopeptide (TPR) repeat protein